jgi:hypothetical protein
MMESASTTASTKERGDAKKNCSGNWTCDGGARVAVDQSARQGTYNMASALAWSKPRAYF